MRLSLLPCSASKCRDRSARRWRSMRSQPVPLRPTLRWQIHAMEILPARRSNYSTGPPGKKRDSSGNYQPVEAFAVVAAALVSRVRAWIGRTLNPARGPPLLGLGPLQLPDRHHRVSAGEDAYPLNDCQLMSALRGRSSLHATIVLGLCITAARNGSRVGGARYLHETAMIASLSIAG